MRWVRDKVAALKDAESKKEQITQKIAELQTKKKEQEKRRQRDNQS